MQYLVIAYDGTDSQAADRRAEAREKHLALGDEMVADGRALFGTAIVNEEGTMIGSMYVVDFPSRTELDAWLESEPYVVGGVWRDISVQPCAVGPSFR